MRRSLLVLGTLLTACHLLSGVHELEYVMDGAGGAGHGGAAAGGSGANNGQPCTAPAECISGFCVDGVCCADACDAVCSSCAVAGSEGMCAIHPTGTDPDGDCESGSCDATGVCIGANVEFARLFISFDIIDLAVGADGSTFVAGSFTGSVAVGGSVLTSEGVDILVARYNATGQHLWSKRFGGTGYDTANGIAVDAQGNVWLTGSIGTPVSFGGSPTGEDGAFLVRLDEDGNHLWSRAFTLGQAWDVEVAGEGVYVLGTHDALFQIDEESYSSPGVFLARFDLAGAPIWDRSYATADAIEVPRLHRLAVSSTGVCAVTGGLRGTLTFPDGPKSSTDTNETDVYLARVDAQGGYQWSHVFATGDPTLYGFRDVAIDEEGNIVVAGRFFGNVDFGSGILNAPGNESAVYVARFDADGTGLWSKSFGDTAAQEARALAVDAAGTLIITGTASGRVDFGGGALTANGTDLFLLRLTADGTHLFSALYGDGAASNGDALAAGGRSLAVGGHCAGEIDFGDGAEMCLPGAFLARFEP